MTMWRTVRLSIEASLVIILSVWQNGRVNRHAAIFDRRYGLSKKTA
jgi:hypothetical protein